MDETGLGRKNNKTICIGKDRTGQDFGGQGQGLDGTGLHLPLCTSPTTPPFPHTHIAPAPTHTFPTTHLPPSFPHMPFLVPLPHTATHLLSLFGSPTSCGSCACAFALFLPYHLFAFAPTCLPHTHHTAPHTMPILSLNLVMSIIIYICPLVSHTLHKHTTYIAFLPPFSATPTPHCMIYSSSSPCIMRGEEEEDLDLEEEEKGEQDRTGPRTGHMLYLSFSCLFLCFLHAFAHMSPNVYSSLSVFSCTPMP